MFSFEHLVLPPTPFFKCFVCYLCCALGGIIVFVCLKFLLFASFDWGWGNGGWGGGGRMDC